MKKIFLWMIIVSAFMVGYVALNSVTVEELLNQKDLIVVQPDYTYPYKNRKEYEKDLDECIEAILNGDFGED